MPESRTLTTNQNSSHWSASLPMHGMMIGTPNRLGACLVKTGVRIHSMDSHGTIRTCWLCRLLAREAEENEAAQELYEPLNLYVDYTIPAGDDEDCDPRIEHVPPLSRQHGDQICELALDGMQIIFHKKNAGNRTDETLEFPEGFHGLKCKFFDADGTLCVMVFEVDGVNTLIYDFFTGQILGGGPMPEAIDWTTDSLRKVSLIEGEGLQVVVTNDAEGIRNITIGG